MGPIDVRRRVDSGRLFCLGALALALCIAARASKPEPIMVASVEPARDESAALRLVVRSAVDLPGVWVEVMLRPVAGGRFVTKSPAAGASSFWKRRHDSPTDHSHRWSDLRLEPSPPLASDAPPDSRPFELHVDLPAAPPMVFRTRPAPGDPPRGTHPDVIVHFGGGTTDTLQAGGRLDLTYDVGAGRYVVHTPPATAADTTTTHWDDTTRTLLMPGGRRTLSPALTRIGPAATVGTDDAGSTQTLPLAP